MGREKDEMMETEERWRRKCQAENLRCAICSSHPPYGERDVFFSTLMCGRCAYIAAKDD